MKRSKYLHMFFRVRDNRLLIRLVAIPTACCFDKPDDLIFSDDIEKKYLKVLAKQEGISLVLPYDDNIFCHRWPVDKQGYSFTHTPEDRAEMLIEAICAKSFYGFYKYQVVCLSEGIGSLQVLDLIQRHIQSNGPLPKRQNTLKIYGFDDAFVLLDYLGKKGVCTPICYSRGLKGLIVDIRHTSLNFCVLKACNASAQNIQNLSGHLISDVVWNRMSNKMDVPEFKGREQTLFVLSELDSIEQIERCLELAQSKKDVIFVLSKDTPIEVYRHFSSMVSGAIPIFCGAPFGHGDCLNKGQPITLFSKADLSCPTGVPVLSWMMIQTFNWLPNIFLK